MNPLSNLRPARGRLATVLCSAAVCAGLAGPAAAQLVGAGGAGRNVRIVRDSAAQNTVAKVYEGLFSYVRIERAEAGAAPSLHPAAASAAALQAALARLNLGSDALFGADELAEITPPLASALARVAPDQDVSFAVSGRHGSLSALVPRSVTTGRVFRSAEGLQLIVGLAQRPFESEFNGTGVLIAFEPGRRAAPVDKAVSISSSDPAAVRHRGDWLMLPVGAELTIAPAAATTAPPAAIPATAAVQAVTPAAPAATAATAAAAPQAVAPADEKYRVVSERLKTLQRLRDAGLITAQEYEDKRKQILSEL